MTEDAPVFRSRTALDLINATDIKPPWADVKACRLDRERLVIIVDRHYEADIERCTNSAKVLDMIYQVTSKTWCTPQIAYDFLMTIAQACEEVHGAWVQELYCPHGRSKRVSWRSRKK